MRLGIDFGTCYSSAALILDEALKPIKDPNTKGYSFPSSIFVSEQGEILVGQVAENSRQKAPHRYRREFKRDLGSPDPYTLGNTILLPEELIAKVLWKLKSEADKVMEGRRETKLTEAILTVPATYSPYKENLMEQAAKNAGFSRVHLLEEPVAAAIYYSHHAKVQEGEIILVYDLGGGTFDATLIQKQASGYQLLGIPKGLTHCGGIDFDRQIYQQLKNQCSAQLRQQLEAKDAWLARAIVSDLCRELKHQLSEEETATIYIPMGLGDIESFSLTRPELNGMIAPLIQETIECCDQLVRNTGISWQKVNYLLLVGGSCRIPYVKEALEKQCESKCLMVDDPELAVCLGATIYGSQMESLTESQDSFVPPEPQNREPDSVRPQENLEEQASLYYRQGLERSQEKAYYKAIEAFNQALQIKPDYAEVYYARALVRQSLEDIKGSLEDLQEAATRFFKQNRLSEYEKTLDKIKKVNQHSSSDSSPRETASKVELTVEELYQQGLTYSNQENYETAIETFEQVLQTQPHHLGAYLHRGLAYFCLGDYQKTIDDSNQVIALNSNDYDALVSRSLAQFVLEKYQESVRDLNQAVNLDKNQSKAYIGRSLIRAFLGDHQGAIADYKQIKQLDNQIDYSEHNRLLSLAVKKNKSEVTRYLRKVAKQFFIPIKSKQTPLDSPAKTNTHQKTNADSQSSTVQAYLFDKKTRFIAESFAWQENLKSQNFSFPAIAQGNRKLQMLPWETFFVFSEFSSFDMTTFRQFYRESFKYCGTLRSANIKFKGILALPTVVCQINN